MKTAHRLSVLIIWLTFCVTLMAQPNAWINEFHYDNEGGDVGEFVEVAVPAELSDKQDLRLCLYNGANGERYDSYHSLDEFIQGGAAGNHILYYTYIDGIQNGPDGLCLDYKGTVIQFLSYEGHFTAMDGPAAGLNSQDIGIQESGSTPLSGSLGLVGDGMNYSEFVWQVLTATPGMPNTDQSLPVELMSFQAEYKDHAIELTWRTASETNCLGFYIERGDSVQGYKRLSNMIQAAGTTSQMQSYAWRDTRIMPNRNYDYQLVEKDGTGLTRVISESVYRQPCLKKNPGFRNLFAVCRFFPILLNPGTVITLDLTKDVGYAECWIYNLLGRPVKQLESGAFTAGQYRFYWDGADRFGSHTAAGVYFCRFQAEELYRV